MNVSTVHAMVYLSSDNIFLSPLQYVFFIQLVLFSSSGRRNVMLLAHCSYSLRQHQKLDITFEHSKSMAFKMRDKQPFLWIQESGKKIVLLFKFEIFCKTDSLDYNYTMPYRVQFVFTEHEYTAHTHTRIKKKKNTLIEMPLIIFAFWRNLLAADKLVRFFFSFDFGCCCCCWSSVLNTNRKLIVTQNDAASGCVRLCANSFIRSHDLKIVFFS